MLSIKQVAEVTGVSAHTLRYYEKIGLLPSPTRKKGGTRQYTQNDVDFMQFLNSLKKTGMTLNDITEFVKDGCIWQMVEAGAELTPSLQNRIEILQKHLVALEAQRAELDAILALTHEKLATYHQLLTQETHPKAGEEA
jgi:DNA-binding transcriptional MerR regulator